jgi:hypothetical protein
MNKSQKPPSKTKQNGKPPSNAGRKPSITPKKRSIFLAAIENGLKVKEALVQANIHESSYKRLKLSSAQFRTEIEVAEMKLTMAARSKVALAIQSGDMPTVRWYLERKVPEEFRPQIGDDGQPAGLPPGTVIVLPGSKPHPRIIPEGETK